MVQSVNHQTLDLSLGLDLRVMSSSSALDSMELKKKDSTTRKEEMD